jgi:hypothetical protein
MTNACIVFRKMGSPYLSHLLYSAARRLFLSGFAISFVNTLLHTHSEGWVSGNVLALLNSQYNSENVRVYISNKVEGSKADQEEAFALSHLFPKKQLFISFSFWGALRM